jgi:hypothetical protein
MENKCTTPPAIARRSRKVAYELANKIRTQLGVEAKVITSSFDRQVIQLPGNISIVVADSLVLYSNSCVISNSYFYEWDKIEREIRGLMNRSVKFQIDPEKLYKKIENIINNNNNMSSLLYNTMVGSEKKEAEVKQLSTLTNKWSDVDSMLDLLLNEQKKCIDILIAHIEYSPDSDIVNNLKKDFEKLMRNQ